MYQKPLPIVGKQYKFSNKKANNPRSGEICTVIVASPRIACVHNALVEFSDGYRMVTSKWNLFELKV
jgi:hypothetical protein